MPGTPPVESDFFPAGQTYKWYDPADWIYEAEFQAAMSAYNIENGIIDPTVKSAVDTTLVLGLKVVAGFFAVKWMYQKLFKPKGKGKP